MPDGSFASAMGEQCLILDENISLHKRICYLINIKGIKLKSELLKIDIDGDCKSDLTP